MWDKAKPCTQPGKQHCMVLRFSSAGTFKLVSDGGNMNEAKYWAIVEENILEAGKYLSMGWVFSHFVGTTALHILPGHTHSWAVSKVQTEIQVCLNLWHNLKSDEHRHSIGLSCSHFAKNSQRNSDCRCEKLETCSCTCRERWFLFL